MRKIKRFLPVLGLFALVFSTNGIKENVSFVEAASSKKTNTISNLDVNATKTRASNMGINITTYSKFKNDYSKLPGYYEYTNNGTTYVSLFKLETNIKYSYTEFTGYVFKYSKEIANTKIYLSNFVSQSIKFSSAIGVYCNDSFLYSTKMEATIGASASARNTIAINRTFSLNDMSDGYYGLMMDFYTCDRLYLKFFNGELTGSILSKNNPSHITDYDFVIKSV